MTEIILAIESSCDETAAALVKESGEVIANVVATQIDMHAHHGGIVPELAARAHLSALLPVTDQAMSVIDHRWDQIKAIAVTQGPGLVGALATGLSFAKALAWAHGIPIVGVDHLTGHLLAVALYAQGSPPPSLVFPFVGLLVSGGHTALYQVDAPTRMHILGQTRDDAAGEAYDKVAKLLGLGYPGGARIDALAALGNSKAIRFPKPMVSSDNLDFSFSGLKTSVAHWVSAHGVPQTEAAMADVCASFQKSIIDVLVKKSFNACERLGIPRLVLSGGVAANRGLRSQATAVAHSKHIDVQVAAPGFCTDNAAMIAMAGWHVFRQDNTLAWDADVYSRAAEVRAARGKIKPSSSR